ncbi:hypothetical protein E1287_07515 [Actinomadura sp. KC06]|uniref:hypothetical protein n=1 Tax=Actinomadura sp. KC06 TaxID=2530369 RepID=UPI001050881E|nr:hypothetical protein [Actinomadura sp. KC06]TDD37896.1 hypothetical protein E1287_07515 [Actinomadura sp. KC06]
MGKPNSKRFRLSQMRQQRARALGGEYVEIEDDDGNVLVQIPRMAFWDAETYEDVVETGVAVRDLATLERIMEPAEFAKLKALKLQLGDMRDLLLEVMKDVKRPESQGSSTP